MLGLSGCLVAALRCLLSYYRATDGRIVNKGSCGVRNLGLQDMSNIVLEAWHQVCLTHWKSDKMVCIQWGLEYCIDARIVSVSCSCL